MRCIKLKKAVIKFNKRTIGIIYFYKFIDETLKCINTKIYRFYDEEGKMISNILLDPYEIKEGLEVEIINE